MPHRAVEEQGMLRAHQGEDGPVTATTDPRAQAEAVLRETRQCYIALDTAGVVQAWNRSASRMFGYTEQEAVGRLLADLIVPPVHRDRHVRALEEFVRTGRGRGVDAPVEVRARRADGTEVPVELTIWAQETPEGYLFHALGSDLSERRAHEHVFRVLAEHRRRLLRIDTAEQARQLLVDTVRLATGCACARLYVPDDRQQPTALLVAAETGAACGRSPEEEDEDDARAWTALREGAPSYSHERSGSTAVEPVVVGERVVAVLVAQWAPPDTPPAAVRELFALLVGEAEVVVQRLELQEELAEAAVTDSLTGLPNRRAFDEALAREVQQVARDERPLTLVLIDLDDFKSHNDTYGHPSGDDLLRRMTAAWRSVVRAPEMLARVGGDEFALLLPGADAVQAAAAVERLVAVTPQEASLSAGAAAHAPGEGPDELLRRADQVLYLHKRARR